ncbi:ABC transporter permease [Actinomadura monticuli]|uniref:ABC transporter permease n=1 Tax=Actinomadura monticuli TaxID=3097367 RepID=A0ABV4Q821_9ACTN
MTRRGVAGLLLLAVVVLLASAGPLVSPWRWDETDFTAFRRGPSARHWLGTTQGGRDVFALVLHGARKSLVIGLLAAALSTGAAGIVGMVAGVAGGLLDRVLMWGADLLLVLPPLLVVAVLAPGGRWPVLVPVLAAFMWMLTARSVRAAALSASGREYVLAARFLGAGAPRVVVRHVLPQVASLLIADASLAAGAAVTAEGGLSYLGLGVRPPDVSLGTIIADGQGAAAGWPFGAAAGLLVLIVLAVNLLGDGLRDVLDPPRGAR